MTTQSPLQVLAAHTKRRTEKKLTEAMFRSVLLSSPIVDKTASWLLAGIAATVALLISNLDKTANILGPGSIRAVLLMLIVGGLFGLLQKHMALQVQVRLAVELEMEKSFSAVLKAHSEEEEELAKIKGPNDPDPETAVELENILKEVKCVVPWYQKGLFKKNLKSNVADQFANAKSMAQQYNRQVMYATAESASAILAICVVAFGI